MNADVSEATTLHHVKMRALMGIEEIRRKNALIETLQAEQALWDIIKLIDKLPVTRVREMFLADGRKVPAAAVHALDVLDESWPGATLPQARAAIAWAVLNAGAA